MSPVVRAPVLKSLLLRFYSDSVGVGLVNDIRRFGVGRLSQCVCSPPYQDLGSVY